MFCGSLFVISWVRVVRSLVFCVVFVNHSLSFCPLSFVHCVICPSSYNDFRLSPFDILKHCFDINNSIRCIFVDFIVINVISLYTGIRWNMHETSYFNNERVTRTVTISCWTSNIYISYFLIFLSCFLSCLVFHFISIVDIMLYTTYF